MANPRIKRLQSDYKKVMARFRYSELIKVRPVGNSPPEKYHVTYHVKGLTKEANGQLKEIETHQVEITFPLVYPKTGPAKNGPNAVIKNTAVPYHPNIDQSRVCWGDHWAAADQLHDVIIRIGQIIAYQSHNIQSPLNGNAARWTAQNEHRLPVDDRDLFPPESIPNIRRSGRATVTILAGSTYTDEGATAKDEIEGSLTSKIKTSGLGFDTDQPGSHTIRYNVKNRSGISAKEVARKVIVEKDAAPDIEDQIVIGPITPVDDESNEPETGDKNIYVWPEGAEDWSGPHSITKVREMLADEKIKVEDFSAFEGSSEGATVADIPGIVEPSTLETASPSQADETAGDDIQILTDRIDGLLKEIAELKESHAREISKLVTEMASLKKTLGKSPEKTTPGPGFAHGFLPFIFSKLRGPELTLYNQETNEQVVITPEALEQGLADRTISMDDDIWHEDAADWMTVTELLKSLSSTAP